MNKVYLVPEHIKSKVDRLYKSDHGRVGGHLHIVLDDLNISDSNLLLCILQAYRDDCERCISIGMDLAEMNEFDRALFVNELP